MAAAACGSPGQEAPRRRAGEPPPHGPAGPKCTATTVHHATHVLQHAAVAVRIVARRTTQQQTAAAPSPAATALATANVVLIAIDDVRSTPAEIARREDFKDEDFTDKDPRCFNYRRVWSSGDDNVVASNVGNWSSMKFRTFVWNNADGRGADLVQLICTRDLANEFDPAVPAR